MIVLIITNILLTISITMFVIVSLSEAAKNSRPIIIKEAKALREYYDGKLKELQEKTDNAEDDRAKYKKLYESELQKNSDASSLRGDKIRLEVQVERLTKELNSCEDRISDMAQENASLKEQIKELEKPAKKKEGK